MYKINRKISIRIEILSKYLQGLISRKDAAEALEVSERQMTRLISRYRQYGVRGLLHGNTGRAPVSKTPSDIADRILYLYRTKYISFNVRHFWEKLEYELDHLRPAYNTVRRLLIKNKLLYQRKKRPSKNRKARPRYEAEGIMVQIDGSHHEWFGGQKSCLIALMDDATGKILSARFSPTETTFATMNVVADAIQKHGKFHLLYSDKAGIYDNKKREGFTQLTRALRKHHIHTILAHSPQAKGRIERLFKTLQSRLIAELHLRKIRTMKDANDYLSFYIEEYNRQFSVQAINPKAAYIPLEEDENFRESVYLIKYRIVQGDSTFSYNRKRYLITNVVPFSLKKQQIEIREYPSGELKFYIKGIPVTTKELKNYQKAS